MNCYVMIIATTRTTSMSWLRRQIGEINKINVKLMRSSRHSIVLSRIIF